MTTTVIVTHKRTRSNAGTSEPCPVKRRNSQDISSSKEISSSKDISKSQDVSNSQDITKSQDISKPAAPSPDSKTPEPTPASLNLEVRNPASSPRPAITLRPLCKLLTTPAPSPTCTTDPAAGPLGPELPNQTLCICRGCIRQRTRLRNIARRQTLVMRVRQAVNADVPAFRPKRILELQRWRDGRRCKTVQWEFKPRKVVENWGVPESQWEDAFTCKEEIVEVPEAPVDNGEVYEIFGAPAMLTVDWYEDQFKLLLDE